MTEGLTGSQVDKSYISMTFVNQMLLIMIKDWSGLKQIFEVFGGSKQKIKKKQLQSVHIKNGYNLYTSIKLSICA